MTAVADPMTGAISGTRGLLGEALETTIRTALTGPATTPSLLVSAAVPFGAVDPLGWFAAAAALGEEAACWLEPTTGRSIVGVGAAASIALVGADRFRLAAAAWAGILANSTVGWAGRGPGRRGPDPGGRGDIRRTCLGRCLLDWIRDRPPGRADDTAEHHRWCGRPHLQPHHRALRRPGGRRARHARTRRSARRSIRGTSCEESGAATQPTPPGRRVSGPSDMVVLDRAGSGSRWPGTHRQGGAGPAGRPRCR